ncbi:MAG: ATP-dependent helicase HrpB [Verrucomicrobiales bacterium]|nr:ATP-dependent helicase HrpB [Verrucomicrobiales bacterium]
MPDRLPIYELEDSLVARFRAERRLIVTAPTGSGKSTQVPQMLLRHGLLGDGQVVVLQPRRLAARLLAARVANELGVELGHEVGYQIRFESRVSDTTRIRFVTEGVLLRQMLDDPLLRGVSALIFDEFHERHLYGDLTLARALDLQESARPDLRLLVMSATLQTRLLSDYLKPGPPLMAEGRVFPVEVRYQDTPSYTDRRPIWEQAADAFSQYVQAGGEGDVLVFMPGAFEIQQTLEAIRHQDESRGFVLLPLHGELAPRDQDAAVARYDRRKVVVSTNVAETSLTIDGVRLVIDSGLARIPRYDPYRGINTLLIEKISRAAADQRAGRAGRTAPGTCIRLWTEQEHAERPTHELPEVKRLDLAEVVLTLKAAGVQDLRRFRWLELPEERALAHAEELLLDLGALKPDTSPNAPHAPPVITPLGRRMLAFPLHPRYARMLLAAQDHGCVYQACLVAALTQGRDLFLRQVDKRVKEYREDLLGTEAPSDLFLLMRAWNFAAKNDYRVEACRKLGVHAVTARQVAPLLDQFLRIAREQGLDTQPGRFQDTALQKCVLIGFSDRVARRLDSGTLRCELVHGRRGVLARESVVQQSPLLVAAEVREVGQTGGETHTILSLATALEPAWLTELFPEDLTRDTRTSYDPTLRRVTAETVVSFRGLTLEQRRLEPPPTDSAARLLAAEVLAGRLKLEQWDHSVDQWILRLNFLHRHCPELGLPPITEEDRRLLVEQVCHGACSSKEIRDKPVKSLVQSWLNAAQRHLLDRHAPERLELANGQRPKVAYHAANPPHIALRIQELFDVHQTPRVAQGRVPILVHILAPSRRPVQVTQDLANFWKEHYPRLKQELQRQYPKHEWR